MPVIINLEGIDGAGKKTLSRILQKRILQHDGLSCEVIDFPAYNTPTGQLVSRFLHGEIMNGAQADLDPYTGSLPFTLDRLSYYKNHPEIFTDIDVLIFNRSYLSNLFYNFSKFIYDDRYNIQGADAFKDWGKIQVELEIFNTPLKDIPLRNLHNFFIGSVESVEDDQNRMMSSRADLDLNEKNTLYLKNIKEFAQNFSTLDIHNDSRISAYYRYQYLTMRIGKSDTEIFDACNEVATQILILSQLPFIDDTMVRREEREDDSTHG